MASKKDNKKDGATKSKKRDKPESKEWEWEDTELKNTNDTSLLAQDVKQLLVTRGEPKQSLKGKKAEMIEYLKGKYTVALKEPVQDLTCKELIVELRLRGLNDSPAKKDILVARLKGLRDDGEPARKKQKRGKKAKLKNGPKVFVAVYTPAADAEDDGTKVLGVFKSELKAYEKGIDRLADDLEEQYVDDKKKFDAAYKKIDKIDDYKKRLDAIGEALGKAFSKDDDAPYCEIMSSSLTN